MSKCRVELLIRKSRPLVSDRCGLITASLILKMITVEKPGTFRETLPDSETSPVFCPVVLLVSCVHLLRPLSSPLSR